MRRLQNGKVAGEDRVVPELLKNGGEAVIDWLMKLTQEAWRTMQVLYTGVEKCNPDTTVQEEGRKYFDKYRGISAQCAWQNVGVILLETMQAIIDPQLMEVQCGFGKERSTVDEIRVMRQVVEKETEYKATVSVFQ